jgi:hypothetical protein
MLNRPSARVAAALALGLGCYAWWVSAQYTRINALNQLELQDAGSELKRVVENALETIKAFKPSKGETAGRTDHGVCVFDDQQPYLEFDGDCASQAWAFADPKLSTANGLAVLATRTEGPAAAPQAATPSDHVVWRVQLDGLFDELAAVDGFDLIFVANQAGQVLYQTSPRNRGWRDLLRWGERTYVDSGARERAGLRIQDVKSLLGADAAPDWARLSSVSDRTSVRVGGQAFQLYVQPVAGEKWLDARVVLGALVRTDRVVQKALAVDTYFVAFFVVALLLALLGIPFLKLASLSAHERFRVRDLYLLYLSAAALVIVSTFMVVGYDGYRRWTREADDGLRMLADDLEARLTTEVRDIRDQMALYDARVAWLSPQSPCTTPLVKAPWPELDRSDPAVLPRNTSVFIDQVTWIDPAGTQIWKQSSDQIGVLRQVPHRPYFKAVRGGHLYRDASSAWPFFVAPDRSITDGRFYTFLSIPSMLDDACANAAARATPGADPVPARGYVAVASTRLLSLEHAALPAGYGFAVVTRAGRTLYHSDSRLGLRENLFEHLDDADQARAIAQSNQTELLSARYREVSHRLRFKPLPWTLSGAAEPEPEPFAADLPVGLSAGLVLVTFRDLSMAQAIVARAFVVSLLPALIALALLGAGLWVLGRMSTRWYGGATRWLWPHGGLAPMYRVVTVSVGLAIVVFAVTTEVFTLAWPYLLLPVVATMTGMAACGRGRWHTTPRRALDRCGWYTAELTLLALALLVVPAAAVMNLTLGHELGGLIETEQARMAAQSFDAPLALRAEAAVQKYPDSVGAEIASAHARRQRPATQALGRGRSPFARPKPFDAALTTLSAGDQRLIAAHEWLDRKLPADSPLLARLRYGGGRTLYTPQGSLGVLSWFGAAALIALIALLAVWIRWSARHLHAAQVTAGDPVSDSELEERWVRLPDDLRHVLVVATEERIANPRQLPAIDALAREGWITLTPDIQPATRAVAALLARERADAQASASRRDWERTAEGHSWHAVRPLLFAGLVLAVVFVTTQPGLQSELAGVAGSVAALGTALFKLHDAVAGWMGRAGGGASA